MAEVDPPSDSDPQQSSHFKAIFDHAPIGIGLVDREGKTLMSNQLLEELTGFSAEELRGLNFNEITHRDDVELNASLFAEMMEGGRSRFSVDKRIYRKDGLPIWVRVTVSALEHDADGRTRFALGLMEDITRQREMERELCQAQKMEAVGRLAGGVAHDFNNQLLVINNYAQMLRDDMEANDPRRNDLDEIVEAGAKATRLVQQLLAFSRRDVVSPQVLSLNDVIQSLVAMLPRMIGEDVEVTVALEDDLRSIRIDLSQIEQIIVNLAVNARAAMPSGGTLAFKTRNVVVSGAEHPQIASGDYVELEVTDNGEGIDPVILPNLFEPFFTTRPRGEGPGLGLATVYGIVDRAGGMIEVSSEPGAGATFRILLPAIAETDA